MWLVVGWGSRVNAYLTVAAYALAHGYGLQFPATICAAEDRASPHCFFQPTSRCGERAVQMLAEQKEREPAGLARDYARYGRTSARDMPLYSAQVELACRRAAEVLGVGAAQCAEPSAIGVLPPTDCERARGADGRYCQEHSAEDQLHAWRVIAKLLLRVQPDLQGAIEREYLAATRSWSGKTFAAVHIRRGDKISEAGAYVQECSYLQRLWDISRNTSDATSGLHVFVATDDLEIMPTLRACAVARQHDWALHSFDGAPQRDESRASVYRLWAEVSLLVDATYTVASYTSNIGRLVQVMRYGKAPETMSSMDGGWFPGRL